MSRRVGLHFRGKVKACLVSITAGSLLLCLVLGLKVAAQGGMVLPGKFEVSPTGAATYTVPIAVPPGSAGMVPSLSIAYSSQGRNGLLGMGWHLEGLPSIGRCPRTMAQDGVRGSVNYDGNDRFCLDGQRLVAISGTYGADGTEYRTEIESFSKIISRGTAGTGPAWFEVWTKSGQRMEFGNTTGSRVLAQGKPTARDWVVNKVSDTKGNYFTVTYVNDTSNGQVYPSRIDYTGNAGLQPYNSVRFVYNSARPDVVPAYHVGSLMKTTVLLTNVQTFTGSTMVADYRLAYEQSTSTGRSRLTSVTLCDGGGVCLPATTFAWQSGSNTPTIVNNPSGQDGTLSGYRPYVADFNGDGLADILWDKGGHATSPSSTGARVLWTRTAAGNFTVTSNFAGQDGKLSGYTPVMADLDRDGRPDVFWYSINTSGVSTGAWAKWLNTGTGTFTVLEGGPEGPLFPAAPTSTRAAVADVDADARADIIWLKNKTATVWITKADGTVSSVTLNGCTSWPGWSGCTLSAGSMDYDGDGLADIFWLDNDKTGGRGWAVWRGQGDGTFSQVNIGSPSGLNDFARYFIDINGDGKTDIVWDKIDSNGRSKGQRMLWLGKGDGTFIEQIDLGGQDGTLVGYRAYISDFNGDGLPDILWVHETGGAPQEVVIGGSGTPGPSGNARVLWLGKGDGNFTVITNFAGEDGKLTGYAPIIADFNGDGKADILWDSRTGTDTRSTGTRVLWLSDGVAPDLMTSVTTGIGAKVSVIYKSMTDSTVYTKDSTPAGPADVVDLQGPMALVSRVDVTNAIGGTVSTGYAYAGAKADLNGRGFVGFRQMTVTDLQTNLVSTTSFRQDYPYIALVADETKKLGAATLNTTAHAYGVTPLGGTRFQPFLLQSQATSADLDGSSLLPTVTSAYKYDAYGNATEIVVSATDGFSKTTTNIFSNDTAKWLLGRLTRATVASLITSPGPPPAQPPTEVQVTLFSSTNNLKLWDHLLASGLAKAGTPGTWTVTISSGVVIGSTSTSLPALDTGAFPAGSILKIINNGTVAGAGGKGAYGSMVESCPASAGGPALRAQVPVTAINNGKIWGGGGGGGVWNGGGGGGAGSLPGAGGWGASCYQDEYGNWLCDPVYPGSPGTLSSGGAGSYGGGAGGNPGQPGVTTSSGSSIYCLGGAAGPAAIGNSFITWSVVGDRKGPLN